jgi:hypothetical protein
MPLTLVEPPGFSDVPETLITANQSVASGFIMSAIKDNCAAGCVMPEFDQGTYTHGQTVRPFVSPVDQYNYPQEEVFYIWETVNTTNQGNGVPSASGGLLWLRHYVAQESGLVNCETYYYVPGGAGAPTNDGVLLVTTVGIRGRQLRKMTATVAGSLTSGTFILGERIIQTSTNATAYVDPGSALPGGGNPLSVLAAVMGTPDATHTWTGQSSGAVYTPTAVPTPIAPKYTDLPASDFAENAPLAQTILRQLNANAKLSTVRTEVFLLNPSGAGAWRPGMTVTEGQLVQPTGRWANGCWYVAANAGETGLIEPGPWPSTPNNASQVEDGSVIWNIAGAGFTYGQQVPLPVSPFDGYEYSAAEIYAVMPFFYTTLAYPVQKGVNIVWTSGQGDIRALSKNITATAPNSVSQLPNGTQPADETGATVYTNWNFTSTPPAEAQEPALAAPGTPTRGCGYVYNAVWFSDAPYADGALFVAVFASRALGGTMASPGGAQFVDFNTDNVLSGVTLPQATIQNINENAKFGILRPEISMQFTVGPDTTVPCPASAWDSYDYSQAECQYVFWWTNTGAAAGDLRDFSVQVNPQNGLVCTRTDYYRTGPGFSWALVLVLPILAAAGGSTSIATAMYGYPGSPVYSNMPSGGPWGVPTVNVAVIQSRQHETELQAAELLISNVNPAPPGSGNLIPNGNFQLQRVAGGAAVAIAGMALDWYVRQQQGTVVFSEEAGIVPGSNFAQGVGCQVSGTTLSGRSTNAVNRGSFVSTIIPIWSAGTYAFQFVAKASPRVIDYGFYCRIHLLDENLANDTAFELLWTTQPNNMTEPPGTNLSDNPGSSLTTTLQSFGPYNFQIPASGATNVQTGMGQSVLFSYPAMTAVTLDFVPCFLYVEIDLWSPVDSGYSGGNWTGNDDVMFAIVDNVSLQNVSQIGVQTFLGAWNATTTYVAGNEVTYSGDYWTCVTANLNSIPSLSNSNWQLVGSGSQFEGAWSSSTAYIIGQEVIYNGALYLCLTANTNEEPDTSPTYWQKEGGGLTWLGAWSSSTAYVIGQMVSYTNSVWLCVAGNTNSAPALGNSNWQIIGSQSEFTGAWSSSTAYVVGQEVSYNGSIYLCLVGNTNVTPTSSATDWQNITGISYAGPWSSSTAYIEGQSVSYNGNVYLCLVANTNVTPASSPTDWLVMGPANASYLPGSQIFVGAWNATTGYVNGNEVTYGGNFWVCVGSNINSQPSATNSNWQLVGPTSASVQSQNNVLIGAWSPTFYYDPGNEVTYGGNYYSCLVQNSNEEPDTSPSYWQLVGPVTVPSSNPIGPWNAGTAYNVGDEVTYTSSASGAGSVTASPASAASVHRAGLTQNTWSNPVNAEGTSAWATATLYGSSNSVNQSDFLELTNFTGLSAIPAGAAITGIKATLKNQQTGGTSAVYFDTITLLGLTGTPGNRAPAYPTGAWPGTATPQSYGSSTDLWNLATALLSQLQASGFGVMLGCQCTQLPGNGATIQLNSVQVTVYYVTSGASAANYYKCVVANTGEEPDISPAYWQLVGPVTSDAIVSGQDTIIPAQNAGSALSLGNANFLSGTTGWIPGNGASLSVSSLSPITNGKSLDVIGSALYACAIHALKFKANPGDSFFASAYLLSDGTFAAGLAINFYDGAGNQLASVYSTPTTSTSWAQYTVSATAPANTAYLMFYPCVRYDSGGGAHGADVAQPHLARVALIDNEITPVGSSYALPGASSLVNGVPYTLQGAWSALTHYLQGQHVTNLGNVWLALQNSTNVAPGSNSSIWQLLGPASLDNVADGSTYARPLGSALTSGQVDLSKSGVIGKTLANVADGGGRYGVVNAGSLNGVASIDGNNRALIDFTQAGHIGKTLANLPDGTGRYAVTNAGSLNGVLSVDGQNRPLINFASAHVNENLYYVADSTGYRYAVPAGGTAPPTGSILNNAVTSASNLVLKNVTQSTITSGTPISSTSATALPNSVTVTTKGNNVEVHVEFSLSSSAAPNNVTFYLYRDGSSIHQWPTVTVSATSAYVGVSWTFLDAPTAASHTYEVYALGSASGGAPSAGLIQVIELG